MTINGIYRRVLCVCYAHLLFYLILVQMTFNEQKSISFNLINNQYTFLGKAMQCKYPG